MSKPGPTPLERLAMKWEARRQAGGPPATSRPERRGIPLQTRPASVAKKDKEEREASSSSSSSESSSSDSEDSSSSGSSSSSSSSSSSCREVRKPGRHKRKKMTVGFLRRRGIFGDATRFKPNTHMLSALVKGQIRTNDRMDREQTENAQERLDTMDGGRSFTKVRIMTSYLTEHGSTGIANSDDRQQQGEKDDDAHDWEEWEKQKRLKFGS